jgi:hypothetical protein
VRRATRLSCSTWMEESSVCYAAVRRPGGTDLFGTITPEPLLHLRDRLSEPEHLGPSACQSLRASLLVELRWYVSELIFP